MEPRARLLLSYVTRGDGRFYVAGAIGGAVGLGLMVASVVLTRNRSTFISADPSRIMWLITGGQVLATAAGFLAGVPAQRRRKRQARAAVGLCPACGYDLRASPDRCPECGSVPEAKPG